MHYHKVPPPVLRVPYSSLTTSGLSWNPNALAWAMPGHHTIAQRTLTLSPSLIPSLPVCLLTTRHRLVALWH
jgi:hypothetical protein